MAPLSAMSCRLLLLVAPIATASLSLWPAAHQMMAAHCDAAQSWWNQACDQHSSLFLPATESLPVLSTPAVRPKGEWRSQLDDQLAANPRCRGVCKYWNTRRGFGFIDIIHESVQEAVQEVTSTGMDAPVARRDVFVHYSDIDKRGPQRLAVGEMLEFQIVRNDMNGRTKATHVMVHPMASLDHDDDLVSIFDESGLGEIFGP